MKLTGLALALALALACGPRRTTPDTGTQTATGTESGLGLRTDPGKAAHARRARCALARAGCRDTSECHGRGICEAAVPTSDPGCGIPPHREERCKADADCKSGEVCNRYSVGCEVGLRCEARCETAGCPEGSLCRADGRCSARRCPDEWSCADYGDCKPPAPGEGPLQGGRDWHGCVPFSCASDAACPCAHCVSGRCALVPGHCFEARG